MPLIADLYHYRFPNNPNLVITDASLEWGGLFDIDGKWKSPHSNHREGRDIDVRIWSIPKDHRDKFEDFCKDMGAKAGVHKPPPHYRLDF